MTATLWRDDRFDLVVKNSDGTPRDISACSLYFGVKRTPGSPLIIAAGPSAGIIFTNPAVGAFAILLPAIAKIGLSPLVTYYWDVLLSDATGALTTPPDLSGTLSVSSSITPTTLVGATAAPANMAFHPEILSFLGGGATALNGYDTSVLSRPFVFLLRVSGVTSQWLARTRATNEAPTDTGAVTESELLKVLPVNWHETTNNVIWERIG